MATAETINTYVDAAVVAIEAADWATALSRLLAAKAVLSTRVDVEAGGGQALRWDRNAIDELIREVKKQRFAGLGIGRSPVTYVRG